MPDRPKKVSAKDALLQVQSGMLVASGGLSAEPIVLLEALAERAGGIAPVTLLGGMLIDGYRALSPHLGNAIRLETWFMPQTLLGDVGMGPDVDFLPMTWTQVCRYVETLDIDVCLVMVSPADENGYSQPGHQLEPELVPCQAVPRRYRAGQRRDAVHPGRLAGARVADRLRSRAVGPVAALPPPAAG